MRRPVTFAVHAEEEGVRKSKSDCGGKNTHFFGQGGGEEPSRKGRLEVFWGKKKAVCPIGEPEVQHSVAERCLGVGEDQRAGGKKVQIGVLRRERTTARRGSVKTVKSRLGGQGARTKKQAKREPGVIREPQGHEEKKTEGAWGGPGVPKP